MIVRALINGIPIAYETSFKIGIDEYTITAIHGDTIKLDHPEGYTYEDVQKKVGQEVIFAIVDDQFDTKLNIPCYCKSVKLMHNTDHMQYYVIELVDLEFYNTSKKLDEEIKSYVECWFSHSSV